MTDRSIESELYYHGLLPREDIRVMLKRNGDFLVRTTEPKAGQTRCFVLSVMYDETREEAGIKHYVVQNRDGKFIIERFAFDTMPEMIQYHLSQKISINKEINVMIKNPINRASWELAHDDIEITKKLGEGAFGEVSLGRLRSRTGSKIDVAIKQAKLENMTKEQIKDITREARLMRMFDHPNVVKLYGVAAGREPLMIVMELADKGSLDSFLQKNALPAEQRVEMCMGACWGIDYLHMKNVIHRDIAARNCLFGDGKVKISDFGLTREGTVYAMDPRNRVPIRWLAPETLRHAMYSQKTDTFAFGILCWEIMMQGIEPYPGMTVAEVNTRVKEGYRMPMPPDCPAEVWAIISTHCWSDSPNERWSMPQVTKRLEQITHLQRPRAEPVSQVPAEALTGTTKERKKKKNKDRHQSRGDNKAIPVIEDAPYCIGFGKREVPKKHGEPNYSEWQFFLIFATRRLTNKQHRSNIVQTDALYKLNLLGYSVLISDANKRFHPTVIGICSSESKFAYDGLFNAIKYADLQNLYHPKLVVRDADTSIICRYISYALRIVWPNSDDQRCFFHVIMNLKKELPKLAAYSVAVAEIQ
uniref:Tyrosine-protein kinase n=1 Tax=Ditylenchus dipsaci TaxID=166011 RepID=A0A915EIQ3_9BILA